MRTTVPPAARHFSTRRRRAFSAQSAASRHWSWTRKPCASTASYSMRYWFTPPFPGPARRPSDFPEGSAEGHGPVRELLLFVVGEEQGLHLLDDLEHGVRRPADLHLGGLGGPHLEEVPDRPHVQRDDDRRLGLVRQAGPGALVDRLPELRPAGGQLVTGQPGERLLLLLHQVGGQRVVLGGEPLDPVLESPMQLLVGGVLGPLDEAQRPSGDVPLTDLAVAGEAVTHELVRQRARDAEEEESEVSVLQDRAVAGLQDVAEVAGRVLVPGALGAHRHVAKLAGELHQLGPGRERGGG